MTSKLKYTCGSIQPSGCVIFTGDLPDFIPESELQCNANLDELLKKAFDKLQFLLNGNDFKQLNKGCLDFSPQTVTAKELHQLEINKICEIDTALKALKNSVDNLNIGNQVVTVNLKCLAPTAAPCVVGTNLYTLSSVLNVLVNEICLIKSQINN